MTTDSHVTNRSEPAAQIASRPFSLSLQWHILIGALLALDALAVWGSLTLAYTVRITSGLLNYTSPYNAAAYQALALTSAPIWLCLFAALGLYRRDNLLGGVFEYEQVARACTAGVMLLIVLSFMQHDLATVSRGWLVLSWVLSGGLVGLERFLVRRVAYGLRKRGWFTVRVLIVGANDQGVAIARQWVHSPTSGVEVAGFVDDFKPLGTPVLNGLRVIGRPTALCEVARRTGAREVVVVSNAVAWETFEEVIARASAPNGYILRLSPGFYEMLTTGVAVTNKTFVPLLTVNEARIVGADAIFKALLDYGLGIPMLILASPIMGLIAASKLARKETPILTRHQAITQRGATFTMLKFNTKRPGDSKVSWLARTLSLSQFAKLPQLLNVLAGQMSLVGPRPRLIEEQTMDPRAAYNLHTVKPGVIGPWTATGHVMSTDEIWDELYYVRNWTIWLDLQILLQSALSLVTAGRQARPSIVPNTSATGQHKAPQPGKDIEQC